MRHTKSYIGTGIMSALLICSLSLYNCGGSPQQNTDANRETATATATTVAFSPGIPADVSIPAGFGGLPIRFFDDYSWRTFIALMWPARDGQRGVADSTKQLTDVGPRVFQTYKSMDEVFHQDGSAPGAWNAYDTTNACGVTPSFGQIVLSSFSKFSNLGQAGFGQLVGPLPCQNGTFTRFATLFNESEFESIVRNKWYLRANLQNGLVFRDGSIDIKCSWIDMAGVQHPERYYTDSAIVMDPATGACTKKLVGLVGMHIVQKTPSRPQWIWSTFEQEDNIPQDRATAPFTYNNGKGDAMPPVNPNTLVPLTGTVFNVTRLKPIHDSTQAINAVYQAALGQQNSVLQHYRLVMTQWPIDPAGTGQPANTFPGTGATTAFANATMETFDQANVNTGCMSCHNIVKNKADFLWSMQDHAFPASVPAVPSAVLMAHQKSKQPVKQPVLSPELQQLKVLLESTAPRK